MSPRSNPSPVIKRPAPWQRYAVALLTVGLATALTWVLQDYMQRTVLILYWAAVIFTALYGGFRPGILATVLSLLVSNYVFIPPRFAFGPVVASDLISMAFFLGIASMTSVFSEQLHRARTTAETAGLQAHELATQLENQATELELQTTELETQYEESQRLAGDLEATNQELVIQSRKAEAGRAIVESSRDSIMSTDLEGRILTWNRGAAELYGYTEAEAVGQSLDMIVPEKEQAVVRELFQRVRRGETIELQETVRRTRSGRSIIVSVSVSPLREGDQVVAVSKIDRDITLQKRTERWQSTLIEATRRLSATLDQQEAIKALVNLLVPADGSMCVVYLSDGKDLSPAAFHQADPTLDGVLNELLKAYPSKDGSPISRVWRTGTAELHTTWTDQQRKSAVHDARHLELSRRIDARSFVVVPLPVRGEVIGVLLLSTSDPAYAYDQWDLTALEELGRRAGIAIDNARAYQAEHAAREEAETANRAKLEFLTRMSHELRTPLNAISGYAHLLDYGIGGGLTADQSLYIQRIQRNQQHLLGLINDVLNFAKLGTGQLRYAIRSVNVAELLQDIEALIGPQVREKSLRLEFRSAEPDLRVNADPDRLHQILLNLLSNAVKFTDPGGSITIQPVPNGNQVEISVTDTGEGIPTDKHQAIFDPFVQVDMSFTRVKEGTGLGLSISRDLARGMGGDITVDSAPGRGSTFTIVLPRSTADTA